MNLLSFFKKKTAKKNAISVESNPVDSVEMIDISNLSASKLLIALWQNGDWKFQMRIPGVHELSLEEAHKILVENHYVVGDVQGIAINADLSGEVFDPTGYDKSYSSEGQPGRAKAIIDALRTQLAN